MTEGKGSRGTPGEARPARVDPRAEPDSAPAPPDDVAPVKRPYSVPRDGVKVADPDPFAPRQSIHPTQKLPALQDEREAQRSLQPRSDSVNPPSAEAAGLASLRHRIPQLQNQLADAHRLLAQEQEERAQDADRIAELVERVNVNETRLTTAEMKLAEATHELEDARQIAQELRISEQLKEDANEVLRKQVGEMQKDAEAHAARNGKEAGEKTELAQKLESVQAEKATLAADLEKARVALEMIKAEREKHAEEVSKIDGNLKQANMKALAANKQLETWKVESQRMMDQLRRDHETALVGQRTEHAAALTQAEKKAEERVASISKTSDERVIWATKDLETRLAAAKQSSEEVAATVKKQADEAIAAAKKQAEQATKAGEERVAALTKLNNQADERFEMVNKQLADAVLSLTATRKERDTLRAEVDQAHARVEQMRKTIEATSEMLTLASTSLEAAEQTEVEIARIREAAKERRRQVLEQALAARKNLQRASPPSAAGSSPGASTRSLAPKPPASSGDAPKPSVSPASPASPASLADAARAVSAGDSPRSAAEATPVPTTLSFISVVPPPPAKDPRSVPPPLPASPGAPPPLPAFAAEPPSASRKSIEDRLDLDDILDEVPPPKR